MSTEPARAVPPGPEAEPVRAAFVAYVRERRHTLFRPGVPDDVVALLGLDDAALERWAGARESVFSLPHASPNVFDPRTRVGWFVGRLQRRRPEVHHVRLVLTHVNFSDLGWRPYGWWYLDDAGRVRCARQFTRNKRHKHVVVASRPPLDAVPEGMTGVDLAAARAAAWGADLAVSYLLIGAVVERAAGMVSGTAASYLPFPLLTGFVRDAAGTTAPHAAWCGGLLATAEGRRVAPDGRLAPCPAASADVFDNSHNLALLTLLGGRTQVAGGAKMAGYWPQVTAVTDRLHPTAPDGCRPPGILLVPEADLLAVAGPSPSVATQLADQGVRYPQGLAVAEHGAFAAHHDPFGA